MRRVGLVFMLVLLAACSAYGENKQIPMINGVPVDGGGVGGGGMVGHGR